MWREGLDGFLWGLNVGFFVCVFGLSEGFLGFLEWVCEVFEGD